MSKLYHDVAANRLEARLRGKIVPEHFQEVLDPDSARTLFKRSVTQVEIETFTYCNRVCWFCPNSQIDRRSAKNYMDPELYLQILRDLGSVDYDGVITYSRYNEPLADRIILQRIAEARELVPKALLSTHTNGDYLNRKYLNELYEAGLRRLRVQVYLGNNDRFDDDKMLDRLHKISKNLGVPYKIWLSRPGEVYEARLLFRNMDLTVKATNFDALGTDRGNLVELVDKFERASPCSIVFEHCYIDWNGCVVPCCNIRSDADEHQPYIVDRLSAERSIFQAYASSSLFKWRRSLAGWGAKSEPCNTCKFANLPRTNGLVALGARLVDENDLP
jgi:hypothetical protein